MPRQPRAPRPPVGGPGGGWWNPGHSHVDTSYWAPWIWGMGSWFFYDPYWWGAPAPPPYGYPAGSTYQYPPVGSVRLKVKPRDAQVFVDGYYAGSVDEFDGNFQRLKIPEGPHRIEVRLDGHSPLQFNVYVLADRTVTLTGTLSP